MFAKRSTSPTRVLGDTVHQGGFGVAEREIRQDGTRRINDRADAADTLLSYEDVEKHFAATNVRKGASAGGSAPVVNRMNLTLKHGEILTLLGPSGCGKTTTLRMAIGLERASAGRVRFGGRTVDSPAERIFVPAEKRNMGMVFQSYAIWPHMTVRDNVAYPLKVRGASAQQIRSDVERMLTMVGLDAIADRPGTRLSGGQQQRVAVARGLVYGPDLLLMDEPFSNLDVKLRDQMRVEVKHIQRKLGISILFVTHDQSEALALSDRVAMMHAGNIEQIASPIELYRAPRTRAARDFIGRSLILPATVAGVIGKRITVTLKDGTPLTCEDPMQENGLTQGELCEVSIRPEHIEIAYGNHANVTDHGNVVSARISTLLFVGERYEAEVVLQTGQMVSVYLSPSRTWEEGQSIGLTLPSSALRVWRTGAVS